VIVSDRIAGLYDRRSIREYARWKVRTDGAYEAVLAALRDDAPLIDLGCGIGLLPLFLRAHGRTAPIIGIDFDERKIEIARRAAKRHEGIQLVAGDARGPLPEGHDVVIIDILHYFDSASQLKILENVARAVRPGGVVVIRQGIRDGSWRYRLQAVVDACGRAIRWTKAESLNYPTRETITGAFEGFASEIRPLWGRTPFNNYLFVFRLV
jgi:SAM-dependent methyltransferase